MAIANTPLFVKFHDFNVGMLKHTQRFPKNLRHIHTPRIEAQAFKFEEFLLMVNSVRRTIQLTWKVLVIDNAFLRRLLCLLFIYTRSNIAAPFVAAEMSRYNAVRITVAMISLHVVQKP